MGIAITIVLIGAALVGGLIIFSKLYNREDASKKEENGNSQKYAVKKWTKKSTVLVMLKNEFNYQKMPELERRMDAVAENPDCILLQINEMYDAYIRKQNACIKEYNQLCEQGQEEIKNYEDTGANVAEVIENVKSYQERIKKLLKQIQECKIRLSGEKEEGLAEIKKTLESRNQKYYSRLEFTDCPKDLKQFSYFENLGKVLVVQIGEAVYCLCLGIVLRFHSSGVFQTALTRDAFWDHFQEEIQQYFEKHLRLPMLRERQQIPLLRERKKVLQMQLKDRSWKNAAFNLEYDHFVEQANELINEHNQIFDDIGSVLKQMTAEHKLFSEMKSQLEGMLKRREELAKQIESFKFEPSCKEELPLEQMYSQLSLCNLQGNLSLVQCVKYSEIEKTNIAKECNLQYFSTIKNFLIFQSTQAIYVLTGAGVLVFSKQGEFQTMLTFQAVNFHYQRATEEVTSVDGLISNYRLASARSKVVYKKEPMKRWAHACYNGTKDLRFKDNHLVIIQTIGLEYFKFQFKINDEQLSGTYPTNELVDCWMQCRKIINGTQDKDDAPDVPTIEEEQEPIASVVKKLQGQSVPTAKEEQESIASVVKKLQEHSIPAAKKVQEPIVPVAKKVQEPIVPAAKKVQEPIVPVTKKVQEPIVPAAKKVQKPVAPVVEEKPKQAKPRKEKYNLYSLDDLYEIYMNQVGTAEEQEVARLYFEKYNEYKSLKKNRFTNVHVPSKEYVRNRKKDLQSEYLYDENWQYEYRDDERADWWYHQQPELFATHIANPEYLKTVYKEHIGTKEDQEIAKMYITKNEKYNQHMKEYLRHEKEPCEKFSNERITPIEEAVCETYGINIHDYTGNQIRSILHTIEKVIKSYKQTEEEVYAGKFALPAELAFSPLDGQRRAIDVQAIIQRKIQCVRNYYYHIDIESFEYAMQDKTVYNSKKLAFCYYDFDESYFCVVEAIKHHFDMPFQVDEEITLDDFMGVLVEQNAAYAMQIAKWVIQTFAPFYMYSREATYMFADNKLRDILCMHNLCPELLTKEMLKDEAFCKGYASLIDDYSDIRMFSGILEERGYDLYAECCKIIFHNIQKVSEQVEMLDFLVSDAMDTDDSAEIAMIRNLVTELASKQEDIRFVNRMKKWEHDLPERWKRAREREKAKEEYSEFLRKCEASKQAPKQETDRDNVYAYCCVRTKNYGDVYYFQGDIEVKVGDQVLVPYSDRRCKGEVIEVGSAKESKWRFPIERMRYIIKKLP